MDEEKALMMMTKKYEEIDIADLHVGDLLLTRFYDEKGAYKEADWGVTAVSSRRYGRGIRYNITFAINGFQRTIAYPSRQKFGRLVKN